MPEIKLDFGGVGEVPEGWFRLSVDKAIYKLNKNKDNHVINLQMRLVDMPDEFEKFEGMTVFDNASMKITARRFLKRKLEAITGEPWSEDNMTFDVTCEICGDDLDTCDHEQHVPILEDQTVVGLVYGELYEGEMQARVSRWLADDGSVQFGPDPTE